MNLSFSRWMGPLVGGTAGLTVGFFQFVYGHRYLEYWPTLMLSTGVGVAGGFLVMLADSKSQQNIEPAATDPRTMPTLPGNALCLLGLAFFFMPFFNVVLSGMALFLNWRVKGWARPCSWIGFILGLSITSGIACHWFTPSTPSGE